MTLRVGIVGAGRMGRERARAARQLGATVSVICDEDFERASALAAETGAIPLRCSDDIDVSRLDAVFVCTPPAFRGPVELRAIDAGIAFFVEKPVALDAQRCARVLECLHAHPVVNAAGYMNRYRESVLLARQEIQHSIPIGLSFQWCVAEYRVRWWLDPEKSGGPINEQCTHFIDLCRFFLGEVVEVQAAARFLTHAPAAEAAAAINLVFQNGVVGAGLYSCQAEQKQLAFEVFLPTRSIRLEGWDLRLSGVNSQEDIFVKEVAGFFEAIRCGDASSVHSTFESAAKTQAVVDAVRRSIRTGSREPVETRELVMRA